MTSKRIFWAIIVFLIVARIVLVFLAVPEDWHFPSGDEQEYFRLAESIVNLDLVQEKQTLGYPLFLAPFIYFTGASETKDIAKPVVIIQAIILFSLSIVLVSLIAKKIFNSSLIGGVSGAIFAFYPYLFLSLLYLLGSLYPQFSAYHQLQGPVEFVSLNWLLLISDPLSAFLVFLCFYLFFKESGREEPKRSLVILLGIICGFAALIRIANILIVGIFVLAWLLRKKIKEACLTAIIPLLVLLPQFIYNHTFFGSPFTFGYQVYGNYSNMFALFSFSRWLNILETVYFKAPILIYVLPLLIIFLALGTRRLIKIDKIMATVLLLWFLSFLVFYISYSYVGEGGYLALRFFIPIVPPLIFLTLASFNKR